ncbi:hypothetical protein [Myroides odoratimimus]|uniref:hypothetical protein n=1 Tax=Myroides odoratimimus TaxID=76832 RepID=UPI000468E6D6|nr:hypothetical protein [Myroides odoratimimus]
MKKYIHGGLLSIFTIFFLSCSKEEIETMNLSDNLIKYDNLIKIENAITYENPKFYDYYDQYMSASSELNDDKSSKRYSVNNSQSSDDAFFNKTKSS